MKNFKIISKPYYCEAIKDNVFTREGKNFIVKKGYAFLCCKAIEIMGDWKSEIVLLFSEDNYISLFSIPSHNKKQFKIICDDPVEPIEVKLVIDALYKNKGIKIKYV